MFVFKTHRKNWGMASHIYQTGSLDGFVSQYLSWLNPPSKRSSEHVAQDEPLKLHVQWSVCPSFTTTTTWFLVLQRPLFSLKSKEWKSKPPSFSPSLLGKLSIKSPLPNSCKAFSQALTINSFLWHNGGNWPCDQKQIGQDERQREA